MSSPFEPNPFGFGPQSCVHCGYELTGLSVPTNCPECGEAQPHGSLTVRGAEVSSPFLLFLNAFPLSFLIFVALHRVIPAGILVAGLGVMVTALVLGGQWIQIRILARASRFIFGPNQLLVPRTFWNSKATSIGLENPVSVTRFWLGGTLIQVHGTFSPHRLWIPDDAVVPLTAGLRAVFEHAPPSNRPTVNDGRP
jgi:hypothetical protein